MMALLRLGWAAFAGGSVTLGLPMIAGIALAAMVGGGAAAWWVQGLRLDNVKMTADLASAESEIREAVRVNAVASATIAAMKESHARDLAAIEKDRRGWANRAKRAEDTINEVIHADPKDNGPIALVLRRALDRLRDVAPAGKGDDHGDKDRAGNRTGAVAPVR